MQIRAAEQQDLEALGRLWHDGWQDAHATIVPAELVRQRTAEAFHARMAGFLQQVRTLGPVGAPLAFHRINGDELDQFYVAAKARGSGVAATLMADAEAELAARGVALAWLACAVGNERAARFYEKSGWRRAGVVTDRLPLPTGLFDLDVWRYEKATAAA